MRFNLKYDPLMANRKSSATKIKKGSTLKLNRQTIRDLVPPSQLAVKGGALAMSNNTEPTVAPGAICSKDRGGCTIG
jgi:hypothetical protein